MTFFNADSVLAAKAANADTELIKQLQAQIAEQSAIINQLNITARLTQADQIKMDWLEKDFRMIGKLLRETALTHAWDNFNDVVDHINASLNYGELDRTELPGSVELTVVFHVNLDDTSDLEQADIQVRNMLYNDLETTDFCDYDITKINIIQGEQF